MEGQHPRLTVLRSPLREERDEPRTCRRMSLQAGGRVGGPTFQRMLLGLLLFAVPLSSVKAQTPAPAVPLRIDLRQAIEMALARNYTIRVQRFDPALADANLLSKQGVFDPALELEYLHSETTDPRDPDFPNLAKNLDVQEDYRAAITGLLPTGMRYSLVAKSGRAFERSITRTESFTTFAGLELTQPLIKGGGTAANLGPIRVARLGQAISVWDLRAGIIDVVAETVLIYNDLYFSMLNLEVAKRSRDLAARLLEDNIRRADIGTMSPLDVTEARADLATRVEDILLAEQSVRENRNFLKRLVTDDLETLLDLRLDISSAPAIQPPEEDVRAGILRALENRPDYRSALLALQQKKITLVMKRNDSLPELDLLASFGANGLDQSLASSFERLGDNRGTEWTLGATLRVPVPNREGRGNLDSARIEVERALLDLKRLEQDIIVEIDNLAARIASTRARIKAAAQSRVFAGERLDAEEKRLLAGVGTTFFLLDAQNSYAAAEVAELRAHTDFNKAVVEYDRATAHTLTRHMIVSEP